MSIFNISSQYSFYTILAEGLVHRINHQGLNDYVIFLPYKKNCIELSRLLEERQYNSIKLFPIYDFDDTDLLTILPHFDDQLLNLKIIDNLEVKMHLIGLIHKQYPHYNYAHLLNMGQYILKIFNELELNGIDIEQLDNLIFDEYSEYWKNIIYLIKHIFKQFKQQLSLANKVTITGRRNYILNYIKAFIKNNNNKSFIAAGFYNDCNLIQDFLHIVSQYGSVVLYGYDHVSDDSLDILNISSVNFAKFLQNLNINEPIQDWVINLNKPTPTSNDSNNIKVITNTNILLEAKNIVNLLIEQKTNDSKVALVSNNNDLIYYVTLLLDNRNIDYNGTLYKSINYTLPGTLFLLIIKLLIDKRFSIVDLLAMLKHPLCNLGFTDRNYLKQSIAKFELKYCRGRNIINSMNGLIEIFRIEQDVTIIDLLTPLLAAIQPLIKALSDKSTTLATILEVHSKVAIDLSLDSQQNSQFFNSEEGNQLKDILEHIKINAQSMFLINYHNYNDFITDILSNEYFKYLMTGASNISINNFTEARFKKYDMVVLGCLNEGDFPKNNHMDNLLDNFILHKLNLNLAAQNINDAAYDFMLQLQNTKIILSRTENINNNKMIASRFLTKLMAKLGNDIDKEAKNQTTIYAQRKPSFLAYNYIDPCPPIALRPRILSVTQIEDLVRDPYHIYVQKILKLKRIDPIEQNSSSTDFGQITHKIIERITVEGLNYKQALDYSKSLLSDYAVQLYNFNLWWPTIKKMIDWIITYNKQQIDLGIKIYSEVTGTVKLQIAKEIFCITAKADRIELDDQGRATIIDFKTGMVPSDKEIKMGLSPQLTLEALIALKGGFNSLNIAGINMLKYISLKGHENVIEEKIVKIKNMHEFINDIEVWLINLIKLFNIDGISYISSPNPKYQKIYNDYLYLSRLVELTSSFLC